MACFSVFCYSHLKSQLKWFQLGIVDSIPPSSRLSSSISCVPIDCWTICGSLLLLSIETRKGGTRVKLEVITIVSLILHRVVRQSNYQSWYLFCCQLFATTVITIKPKNYAKFTEQWDQWILNSFYVGTNNKDVNSLQGEQIKCALHRHRH